MTESESVIGAAVENLLMFGESEEEVKAALQKELALFEE